MIVANSETYLLQNFCYTISDLSDPTLFNIIIWEAPSSPRKLPATSVSLRNFFDRRGSNVQVEPANGEFFL